MSLTRYLDNCLTDKHKAYGLSLEELDDHFLYLKVHGKKIAVFNQCTTSSRDILQAADDYLLEVDAQ
jgi:hypothetical protein